ncbi:unnamed protein product [Darwinula stevensoni]|uniref:Uncharacterized protein n=1 Tax=Darwinula stevensoni TaxID=69355 RepID=A0A7R8ZZN5_9CRUS|nr:unnamed protein product [Darwinula stevensoni]CAG0884066.1 unnamed protein product [Darwinula stevensoni]
MRDPVLKSYIILFLQQFNCRCKVLEELCILEGTYCTNEGSGVGEEVGRGEADVPSPQCLAHESSLRGSKIGRRTVAASSNEESEKESEAATQRCDQAKGLRERR